MGWVVFCIEYGTLRGDFGWGPQLPAAMGLPGVGGAATLQPQGM